jgi:F-type H+-transporting ATPase subunit delta
MSRGTVVAKRYAKALFEIAQQQNIVADVEQQLKGLAGALEQDPEILKFLAFPNIDTARKVAVLKDALGSKFSEAVLNTAELLIARGRQDNIPGVYEAYTKIAGEATGQANATVYTAKQLTGGELEKVVQQFSKTVGKTIRAEQVVEPSLLGGIQVRIGDRLYDGSLSGKLARLEKTLKSQAL